MKDIAAQKMLVAAIFGLEDDSFMLTVAVIMLLVWISCLVLILVEREGKASPPAQPAAEPSKAPYEESSAGSAAVQASTRNIPIGTKLGRDQRAAGENTAREICPRIAKEQKTLQVAGNPIH